MDAHPVALRESFGPKDGALHFVNGCIFLLLTSLKNGYSVHQPLPPLKSPLNAWFLPVSRFPNRLVVPWNSLCFRCLLNVLLRNITASTTIGEMRRVYVDRGCTVFFGECRLPFCGGALGRSLRLLKEIAALDTQK